MDALPTTYNGIRFRSLLEARWAAFFDLLHWPYVYEPCALNGWVPDFLLRLRKPVFVEVKPVTEWPQQAADQIDASGCPDECLIVGLGPQVSDEWPGHVALGWLRELCGDPLEAPLEWAWDEALLGIWGGSESPEKNPQRRIGFCHAIQSFVDRVTGCYDGGFTGGNANDAVLQGWNDAGQRVQWRRKPGTTDARGRHFLYSRIVHGLRGEPLVQDVWRVGGLEVAYLRPVGPPQDAD